jgi:hypothetical protein
VSAFIAGALMVGYLVIGLFFLRFSRDTGDRLFAIFAAAFFLLALQRLALFYYGEMAGAWVYGLRLVAFLLILFAVIDKNRAATA